MNEKEERTYGVLLTTVIYGLTLLRGVFSRNPTPAMPSEEVRAAPALPSAPKKIGRAADVALEPYSDSAIVRRRGWGTLLVGCAFGIGMAAGVAFLFVYWTGGGNTLLGGMLAISLAGFGGALIFCAHWLVREKQAVELREKMTSSNLQREGAFEDYCAGAQDIQRRGVLKWMVAAGMGLFGGVFISLLRSLGPNPSDALFTTVWRRGQRVVTADGKPVTVVSLETGSAIMVFPETSIGSEKTQTVLIRVQEQLLQLPKDRTGWTPMGYVAYSRVCTHAGCPVGLYESESHLLLCPCHQSTFDVLRGAVPTAGPAARPLPQLPLYADSDGNLRAAGGFTEPPGPGFWGMP